MLQDDEPSMSRHSNLKPLVEVFATVGTQWSPVKRPARSRTPSVMITFVPAGNGLLNVTSTELLEDVTAPAR